MNQHRSDFENMLKEAADSLKLSPAPKVWSGIFNQLHPGMKYPSVQTVLIIMVCYLLIGVNKDRNISDLRSNKTVLAVRVAPQQGKTPLNPCKTASVKAYCSDSGVFYRNRASLSQPDQKINNLSNELKSVLSSPMMKPSPTDTNRVIKANPIVANPSGITHSLRTPVVGNKDAQNKNIWIQNPGNSGSIGIAYQIYATPAFRSVLMGNHSLNNDDEKNTPSLNEADRPLLKLNFEAGGNIIVPINPHFRIKAGFQFNYYRTEQAELNLSVTDGADKSRSDAGLMKTILNDEGDIEHAELQSYQLSMPIGADVMLAGDNSIQWYAGATIQPGLLMPGDNKSPAESELSIKPPQKKWNMHGGIETFINVKLNRMVNVNLGPQFRYEIISSFRNPINFYDRPFQLGFKFGITTAF